MFLSICGQTIVATAVPRIIADLGGSNRLEHNLKHLVTAVDDLRSRGIGLWVLTGAGAETGTATSNGRLVFGILAPLAEFECELISECTRAFLVTASARGRLGGRPRKMDVAMPRLG